MAIAEKTNRVVFLRCAKSEWTETEMLTGLFDSYLTVNGIIEAHDAAKEIIDSGYTFDVVFISDLVRARKLGQILLKHLNLEHIPIYHSWRLNERHRGWFTGFKQRDVAYKYGLQQALHWYLSSNRMPPAMTEKHEFYQNIVATNASKRFPKEQIPKVETIDSCAKRISPYWEEFIGHFIRNDKKVLIIVHEHSFRGFVKLIQNVDDNEMMQIKLPPASMPVYYDLNQDLTSTSNMGFICGEEKMRNWYMERWNEYASLL